MSDLIDRQALLRQIDIDSDSEPGYYGDTWKFIDTIKRMPSALSTNLASLGTDCISRQAAIDAFNTNIDELVVAGKENADAVEKYLNRVIDEIKQLPPIQPDNCSEFPNNSDAISRAAAIDALDKCYCGGKDENGRPWIYKENAVEVIEMVEPLPSAEPKRGKWISADAIFGGVPFYCSECGENTWDTVMGKPRWNFCPNCGADMRGEQDG